MESTLRISSGSISDRGLNDKRLENEDAFLERPDCGIFAVADGVGGAQAGDVASQMAVEVLHEAFINLRPGTDPEAVMRSAIERANTAIYQMAHDLPQLSSMATTVVGLYVNGNIATVGHVGDSRLYRVDREGNFYRETDDHSMVAEEVRAGRMTEEQAENHPSRNIISRALGAESDVIVDTKTFMIDSGTAFLLCSDGITRHVTDQEIKGVLTFGGSPSEIGAYLKDLCYQRGAEDNLTAVIVKTGSGAISKSTDEAGLTYERLRAIETEEITVVSARDQVLDSSDDDTDLLELSTKTSATAPKNVTLHPKGDEATLPLKDVGSNPPSNSQIDSTGFRIEPPATGSLPKYENGASDFSVFGRHEKAPKGSLLSSKLLSSIVLVLIGALLGAGAFYLTLSEAVDTVGPRPTEMRAANIPLSAFEENRRNVDKDPTGYLARFSADPQDCEDYFLVGRAYLLTGDFSNARNSLIQARDRLGEADPSNALVLASDIALAISATNGTTAQTMLTKEFEAIKGPKTNTTLNANQAP